METVTVQVEVPIDVQLLAHQFARLGDTEQAEFFHEVQRYAVATFKNKDWGAECQWSYIARKILEAGRDSPGWKFVCDLGAFTMVHSYNWAEKNLARRYE